MKVKEKIIDSISKMDEKELNVLYGQIRILELIKSPKSLQKAVSIERIREMTSTSKSNWAEAVMEDREERL
jgi:hypothetical protein